MAFLIHDIVKSDEALAEAHFQALFLYNLYLTTMRHIEASMKNLLFHNDAILHRTVTSKKML